MADTDNLDSLSNAELRAQMMAQGLPNIPITDSSRKVLVKRLRTSLGGNAASPAAATPKKAGNRRETMQPVAATVAAQVDKSDGLTKTRRSIAFSASDTKEAERRRKPETVAAPPRESEAVKTVAVAAKAAPIQSRRTSNTEHREVHVERVVKKPETIAEETMATKVANQPQGERTLAVNSLIILESDEEEEAQMSRAVKRAEEQLGLKQKTVQPTSKLTATTTSTHQYVGDSLYRSLESTRERIKQQPLERPSLRYEQAPTSYSQAAPTTTSTHQYISSDSLYSSREQKKQQPLDRASLNYEQQAPISHGQEARTSVPSSYASSGRYSSYLNMQAQGRAVPAKSSTSAAAPATSYRRSPQRSYTTEFSDDTADDEPPSHGVQFESDFARKLAQLRAERIGDRSSSINRHITGGRRSLRPDHEPTSVVLGRWWQSLDRKYNLKSKLFILIVALLLYVAYRIYN